MDFHIINVVWGEEYTDLFLKVCLPSQLSPGNLPAFSNMGKSAIYKLYTTEKDAETIVKSPVFSELCSVIPVQIVKINIDIDLSKKYEAMIHCHNQAIAFSHKLNAKLVFLSPDSVLADKVCANLIKIEATGKLVVMLPAYRTAKETFVPALMQAFYGNNVLRVSIQSRDLVGISLEHLHPYSQALIWDATDYNTFPSHIYWKVNDKGLLGRCFNMHPLMINPQGIDVVPQGTIDGEYWEQICPNLEDVYIVKDSDEMFAIEFSSVNYLTNGISLGKNSNVHEVAEWAMSRWNNHPCLHGNLLKQQIRIHGEDINDEEWRKVENDSDKILSEIYQLWGIKLKQAGKLQEALDIYSNAIELNHNIDDAHHSLGELLAILGRLEEAVTSYQRAIELNQKSIWSYYNLGELWATLSRWDEAIACYRNAIALKPDESKIYYSLAQALNKLKH